MRTPIFTCVAAGALAMLIGIAPERATAALITINSTVPTWSGTIGGTNINTTTSGGGNNTVTQIRWGNDIGDGQSGLGFNPANPPAIAIQTDTSFLLGTLTHYNNPIAGGSAASSTLLNLLTDVLLAVPTNQTFAYRFNIDETPNVAPCAYPSNTPCADKITFVNVDPSSAFTVNGGAYSISLLGFSTDGGSTIVQDFISQEGGTRTAGLYAVITAPTPVPEPASMLLFGTALIGLGLARQRRVH